MAKAVYGNLVMILWRRPRCRRWGILCADSHGYEVEVNEGPLLGLSNMRSALQAFQGKPGTRSLSTSLVDALTKKQADFPAGLIKFLHTNLWSIAFDPTFTSARKNKQKGHAALGQVDDHLRQSETVEDSAWLRGARPRR